MTKDYSNRVLNKTLGKAINFYLTLAKSSLLRKILYDAGMQLKDLDDGGDKIRVCIPKLRNIDPIQDTESARKHREVVVELDNSDELLIVRCKSPLKRFYPATMEYLFDDLKAARGQMAVQVIATLLARMNILENGTDPSRRDHFEDDKAAMELLAERGIDAAERNRLQALVDIALTPTEVPDELEQMDPEVLKANKVALKEWYDDWSSIARAVVKKRSNLIKLGLATRRKPKKKEEGPKE